MNKIILSLSIAGALLALGLATVPARAATQTWVSGHGTDTGACGTVAAPCRTFAFAIGLTTANGEIDVLDPANYGVLTINKSISIANDGVGDVVIQPGPGGTAITINAGAGGTVHLRGLTLEGVGVASNGIVFNSGASLEIESCVVRHFTNNGINITSAASASFVVSNTIVSDNGGFGIGVSAAAGRGTVVGVISKTITNNNSFGINVGGIGRVHANVTIVDSVASNNTDVGIAIGTELGGPFVLVRNSVASNNGTGLVARDGTLNVGHSVVAGNGTGVSLAGGTNGILNSYGDNDIDGNGNDNTGILQIIPTR